MGLKLRKTKRKEKTIKIQTLMTLYLNFALIKTPLTLISSFNFPFGLFGAFGAEGYIARQIVVVVDLALSWH
jgi:hypothetical protein